MPINSPKIIGFCGYPGSGKDVAAEFLVARGWQRVAFADPLRKMALAIDPWICDMHGRERLSDLVKLNGWLEVKKLPEVRRLLQYIGTQAVREIIGPNTWVDIAVRSMEPCRSVVITDVRFANEAEMIRRRGGLICWVQRDSAGDRRHNAHISEQYPFTMDRAINNNGTLQELENKILELAGISL